MSTVHSIILLFSALIMASCASNGDAASAGTSLRAEDKAPAHPFSADSAYAYVKAQVDMGPRVPGTDGHHRCADYLIGQLRRFGADSVEEQRGTVTAFDGTALPIRNIIAHFHATDPNARRIVLIAHYDTRPWADEDPDPANRSTPIDGANDGASGVGVLLEIARLLGTDRPAVAVDIFLTDAEDYGSSDGMSEDSWCLGTQHYLASNPYPQGKPAYGILLDMVGGKGAKFYREYFSQAYAPAINNKVWSQALKSGYSSRFVDAVGGGITDDHLPFTRAGIPTIDIIEMNHPATGSFPPYWHTRNDNISQIDPATLGAVGQVVTDVIYNEK